MKRVLLVVLLGAIAVFCVMNRQPTPIWPFKGQTPLFIAILAALALGLAVGWLARAISSSRRQAAASAQKAEAVVDQQAGANRVS